MKKIGEEGRAGQEGDGMLVMFGEQVLELYLLFLVHEESLLVSYQNVLLNNAHFLYILFKLRKMEIL